MRGHRTGRIALAVALVALPLAGLTFLLGDDAAPDLPAVPREALARLAPGQAGDALAVRPATDAEPTGRAAGVRDLTLLAVLAAAGGALVLLGAGRRAPLRSAPVPAGRHRSPRERGPPSRFPC